MSRRCAVGLGGAVALAAAVCAVCMPPDAWRQGAWVLRGACEGSRWWSVAVGVLWGVLIRQRRYVLAVLSIHVVLWYVPTRFLETVVAYAITCAWDERVWQRTRRPARPLPAPPGPVLGYASGVCCVCHSQGTVQPCPQVACGQCVCQACSDAWMQARPGAMTWACCGRHRHSKYMSRAELQAVQTLRARAAHDANLTWSRVDPGKPCPRCGMGLRREGGCHHMLCPECGCSFCWVCGAADVGFGHLCKDM